MKMARLFKMQFHTFMGKRLTTLNELAWVKINRLGF